RDPFQVLADVEVALRLGQLVVPPGDPGGEQVDRSPARPDPQAGRDLAPGFVELAPALRLLRRAKVVERPQLAAAQVAARRQASYEQHHQRDSVGVTDQGAGPSQKPLPRSRRARGWRRNSRPEDPAWRRVPVAGADVADGSATGVGHAALPWTGRAPGRRTG